MRAIRSIAPLLLLLILAVACDFPSDPPLISGDNPDTPGTDPKTSKELLPLKEGNQWFYVYKVKMRPGTNTVSATMRTLLFQGREYHFLRYRSIMGPVGETNAFPVLLAHDSTGLSFSQPADPRDTLRLSRAPILLFHFPYPARPGGWKSTGASDFSVRLTHVDTLMTVFNSNVQLRCNRYEVARRNSITQVFYIVPGICILRIEGEDVDFHTVGWQLH